MLSVENESGRREIAKLRYSQAENDKAQRHGSLSSFIPASDGYTSGVSRFTLSVGMVTEAELLSPQDLSMTMTRIMKITIRIISVINASLFLRFLFVLL